MDWIIKHKLLSIGLVSSFVLLAFYFLPGSSEPTDVLSSQSAATVPDGTNELVTSLLALRSVTLEGTIFATPSFQSLQDFTKPIVAEPVGRANPFAPLSAENTAALSSTSTRTIGR